MNSPTADGGYSDARAFCVFNAPESLFLHERAGGTVFCVQSVADLNWEKMWKKSKFHLCFAYV